MQKYLLVTKLAIQDVLEYKFDFVMNTLKYALMVALMAIVWLAVEKSGQVGFLTPKETVSYFLFAALFYSLSNFHTWYIELDIQRGNLSKYLLKPVSPSLYYFFHQLAQTSLELGMKTLIFIVMLAVFRFLPTLPIAQLPFLIVYLPLVFVFSFQWLSLISILSFWITEAYAVRWAVTIFTRFMSGLLVPIVYFPEMMKPVLFYLPFQHLAFTPIEFMLGNVSLLIFVKGFLILLGWTMVLSIVRQLIWNVGVYQYEGTGI